MFWLRLHLRVAYSTEIGAVTAYRGHAAATRDPVVASLIRSIEQDERHHRVEVGKLLERFDAQPFVWLDLLYTLIGTVVGFGCHFWGPWASAFGAAQFEFGGVGDYRRAARAARAIGNPELAAQLETYQAQEAAHRAFFLDLARATFPIPWVERPPLDMGRHPSVGARGAEG